MPRFCGVVGCANRADREQGKSFFRLPAVLTRASTAKIDASSERRQKWISAIKREDLTEKKLQYLWICEDHFITKKPADLLDKENPDWIPTVNMGYDVRQTRDFQRYKRLKSRNESRESLPPESQLPDIEEPCLIQSPMMVDNPNEVETQTNLTGQDIDALIKANQDYVCEVSSLKEKVKVKEISEEMFKEDDERVRYYSGLPSYAVLMLVFNLISSLMKERDSLTKFQQFMLTMMKMRLNLDFHDLGYRFCVSQSTTSRVFYKCLTAMFIKLQRFIVWPDRDTLRCKVPEVFKQAFGSKNVTVVIDCFEIECEKPSNVLAQAQTWSNYKQKNTTKYLIGMTPQGNICYISRAYGGRSSDTFITEDCGIMNNLLPHDVIVADRGFNIQDPVSLYCCEVLLPAFKLGKKQLRALDIEKTRSLASVRIHVERIIGVLKQKYTILEGKMRLSIITKESDVKDSVLNQILTVTCALVNLCPAQISCD